MNKIKALLCLLAMFSMPSYGATVHNIDATVYGFAWTTIDQYIGTVDGGYPIVQGDSVNMHVDFVDGDLAAMALKLTANAGASSLGFMLDRPGGQFSLWTIENVSVVLDNFATDGSGNGVLGASSMSFSGGALGAFFQQAAFGVADGEFIQFSGFQLNFDVVSLANPNGDFTHTAPIANNWTVESAAVVPIPAAAWLLGSGLGMLGWMRRRKLS